MATSSSIDPTQQGVVDELLTLADLAGIKGPGHSIKAVIELVMVDLPPKQIHTLLRNILASKSRSKRDGSKHSSRSHTSSAVPENSTPQN